MKQNIRIRRLAALLATLALATGASAANVTTNSTAGVHNWNDPYAWDDVSPAAGVEVRIVNGANLTIDDGQQHQMHSLHVGMDALDNVLNITNGNLILSHDTWGVADLGGGTNGGTGTLNISGSGVLYGAFPIRTGIERDMAAVTDSWSNATLTTTYINLTDGGRILQTAGNDQLSWASNSNTIVNITNASWVNTGAGYIRIGAGGSATINVNTNGNLSFGGEINMGYNNNYAALGLTPGYGEGHLNVSGANARVTAGNAMYVGVATNGTGTLNVTNGGAVTIYNPANAARGLALAYSTGSVGNLLLDNGTVRVLNNNASNTSGNNLFVNVGAGANSLSVIELKNGSEIEGGYYWLGRGAGSTITFNVTDSKVTQNLTYGTTSTFNIGSAANDTKVTLNWNNATATLGRVFVGYGNFTNAINNWNIHNSHVTLADDLRLMPEGGSGNATGSVSTMNITGNSVVEVTWSFILGSAIGYLGKADVILSDQASLTIGRTVYREGGRLIFNIKDTDFAAQMHITLQGGASNNGGNSYNLVDLSSFNFSTTGDAAHFERVLVTREVFGSSATASVDEATQRGYAEGIAWHFLLPGDVTDPGTATLAALGITNFDADWRDSATAGLREFYISFDYLTAPVPEPATTAALLGLATLALLLRRRK